MNLMGLNDLEKVTIDYQTKPDDVDFIYYIFWEKGISLKEFNELPLPYIFSVLRTFTYIKQQEEKEYKKTGK